MPSNVSPGSDPRTIVTPWAFNVDRSLVGMPLAPPHRRLFALLLDLLLVVLLTNAGGVLLGILAAVFFLRMATRRREGQDPAMARVFRGAVGCVGGLVLFITILTMWGAVWSLGHRLTGGERARGPVPPPVAEGGFPFGERGIPGLPFPLPEGTGEEEPAQEREAGAPEEPEEPEAEEPEAEEAPAATPGEPPARIDPGAVRIDTGAPRERERGVIRSFLARLADDLGLGIGWSALYFSVFLSWWGGRTPGKWLFGLRVVRLDRRPIGWWTAFERYGGYAAGLATGLLGFAQVYWDPNRQATHDKIAGTVVILDGKGPVPGPWLRPDLPDPDAPEADLPQPRTEIRE